MGPQLRRPRCSWASTDAHPAHLDSHLPCSTPMDFSGHHWAFSWLLSLSPACAGHNATVPSVGKTQPCPAVPWFPALRSSCLHAPVSPQCSEVAAGRKRSSGRTRGCFIPQLFPDCPRAQPRQLQGPWAGTLLPGGALVARPVGIL